MGFIFFDVHLGVSILGIGSRHLMKRTPTWISQLGSGKLFEKLPTNLYRIWSANLCAHNTKIPFYSDRRSLSNVIEFMEMNSSMRLFIKIVGIHEMHQSFSQGMRRSQGFIRPKQLTSECVLPKRTNLEF